MGTWNSATGSRKSPAVTLDDEAPLERKAARRGAAILVDELASEGSREEDERRAANMAFEQRSFWSDAFKAKAVITFFASNSESGSHRKRWSLPS